MVFAVPQALEITHYFKQLHQLNEHCSLNCNAICCCPCAPYALIINNVISSCSFPAFNMGPPLDTTHDGCEMDLFESLPAGPNVQLPEIYAMRPALYQN